LSLTIVPSIDLRAGRVVRLQQGDYNRQLDYDLEPSPPSTRLNLPAPSGSTSSISTAPRKAIPPRPSHLQARRRLRPLRPNGGGIRRKEDIDRLILAGVQRIVVGTQAMENWAWFKSLVHEPRYARKIVLAVDAKEGMIAVRGWTKPPPAPPSMSPRKFPTALAAILYTDVAKDGMLEAPICKPPAPSPKPAKPPSSPAAASVASTTSANSNPCHLGRHPRKKPARRQSRFAEAIREASS